MYVLTYVRMYLCMYVCVYVRMYVGMHYTTENTAQVLAESYLYSSARGWSGETCDVYAVWPRTRQAHQSPVVTVVAHLFPQGLLKVVNAQL